MDTKFIGKGNIMIIVIGWVRLAAGEMDRLHDAAVTMLEETRKEDGCISYTYGRAVDEPDVMQITEIWESQEALTEHSNSAHMAAFNQAMGGAKILGISVKSYPAEAGKTLLGED